jgi:hypothetical protein
MDCSRFRGGMRLRGERDGGGGCEWFESELE